MFENEDSSDHLRLSPVGGRAGPVGGQDSASPVSPLEGITVIAEADELESINVVSHECMEDNSPSSGSPSSAGLSEYLGLEGEEGAANTAEGDAGEELGEGGGRGAAQPSTAPQRLLGRAQGLLTDMYAEVGRVIMPAVRVMQSHGLQELCALQPKLETIVQDITAILGDSSESFLPSQAGERDAERPLEALIREASEAIEASKVLKDPYMEGVRGSVAVSDIFNASFEDASVLRAGLGCGGAVTSTDGGVDHHTVGCADGVTLQAAEPGVTERRGIFEEKDEQPGRSAPPVTRLVAGDTTGVDEYAGGQGLVGTRASGEVGGGGVDLSTYTGEHLPSQSVEQGVRQIGVAARGLGRCTPELHATVTPEWGAEEAARQPLRPTPVAPGVRGSSSDVFGLRDQVPNVHAPPSTNLTQEAAGPTSQHTPHAPALTTRGGDTASSSGAASSREEFMQQVRDLREEAQGVTRGMRGDMARLQESQQSLGSVALRAMATTDQVATAAGRRDCCKELEKEVREYRGRLAGLEQSYEAEQERHRAERSTLHTENLQLTSENHQLTIELTCRNAEFSVLKEANDELWRDVHDLRRELADTRHSEQMLRDAVAVHEVRQGQVQGYCRDAMRQAELHKEAAKRADARAEAAERAQRKAEGEARDAARLLQEEQERRLNLKRSLELTEDRCSELLREVSPLKLKMTELLSDYNKRTVEMGALKRRLDEREAQMEQQAIQIRKLQKTLQDHGLVGRVRSDPAPQGLTTARMRPLDPTPGAVHGPNVRLSSKGSAPPTRASPHNTSSPPSPSYAESTTRSLRFDGWSHTRPRSSTAAASAAAAAAAAAPPPTAVTPIKPPTAPHATPATISPPGGEGCRRSVSLARPALARVTACR